MGQLGFFDAERRLAAITAKGDLNWSRLSEQLFRVDKWSVCRG
jgi:hypothetical protein